MARLVGAAVAALLCVTWAAARDKVETAVRPGTLDGVGTLAVSLVCPPQLECLTVEGGLHRELRALRVRLLPPETVWKARHELASRAPDERDWPDIAAAAGADAIAVIIVQDVEQGGRLDGRPAIGPRLAMVEMEPWRGARAAVTLTVLAADGRVLASGSASGGAELRDGASLVARLARSVLEEVFGQPTSTPTKRRRQRE